MSESIEPVVEEIVKQRELTAAAKKLQADAKADSKVATSGVAPARSHPVFVQPVTPGIDKKIEFMDQTEARRVACDISISPCAVFQRLG